jgi:hypothetical protein
VSALDRHLVELLTALESADLDPARVDRAAAAVDAGVAGLTRATPRVELERIASLHACIREKARQRRLDLEHALQIAQGARARLSRLTRPSDATTALDVSA